ncbi:MAG: N-acetylmuramoyl-L-alanine amidase, partial [Paraclostridium sp.]
SNENTAQISESGILTPINEGTVFLSQEIGENAHIIEVYVSSNIMEYNAQSKSKVVDRNYYKVFVDVGHGGHDNGASGNGNLEDELNLQIAKKVEDKLKSKGIEVKMSRYSDTYVSLSERAKMANSYGSDVFVSIHQNSASASSANGIETYHHSNKSSHKPYSQSIQEHAINETNARNRGVKSANFSVLRETNMPSALFESGFINNPNESQKLANPVYQNKLAQGIVNGIEEYLKENIHLTGEPVIPENPNPPVEPEIPDGNEEVIKTGEITASSLNVRSGYGTSYSKIGSLSKGSKVEIVEEKSGWYKIKYNSGYGYISGEYVNISSGEVAPPEFIKKGKVSASKLNVRSGYGTNNSVMGSLSRGAIVEIVESKNGWHKIKFNGNYGYVSGQYISII